MNRTHAIALGLAAFAFVGLAVPLAAQGDAGAGSDAIPLDVVVTGNSAPGWMPSEQLAGQAVEAFDNYFKALDSGDYPRSYAMLAPDIQKETPAATLAQEGRSFNAIAGKMLRRRMVTSTWSKDPPGAPKPGVYVIFALAAQFTNIDRQCGSLSMFQDPAGGAFQVLGSENYFLDNGTAQRMELSKSHQAVLDEWAKISASCAKFSWDAKR